MISSVYGYNCASSVCFKLGRDYYKQYIIKNINKQYQTVKNVVSLKKLHRYENFYRNQGSISNLPEQRILFQRHQQAAIEHADI
jgi:hypothetical protein